MSSYPWAAGYIDDGDRPKLVTSRFEHEDSYTLERYHATGGYAGLRAALGRTPAEVHDEVRGATVLGRGGAGFPAGVKWGLMPAGKYPRYLVVNGDESEPGTYKDRLLMERDPHQLVEGCLIAAYAAGLSQVFLYIRGEMPLAHERVAVALNDAYAAGYVGKNILGTNFSVDIVLHWGAGAYVVGEETALIESLEGKRGEPRLKPPFFPAAIGLYGQPTIVNNVETLANLPWIATNGVPAYTAIGTATSPGTRMVAVSGHVKRPGLYEVGVGVTLRLDRPDGALWACAVPGSVEQILDNLLDNALQVSPAGQEVTVTLERAGDRVRLRVADRGLGLNDAQKARALERFWRGAQTTPGTGLGLPIAVGLTEASGGGLSLADRPGGGLLVELWLPCSA